MESSLFRTVNELAKLFSFFVDCDETKFRCQLYRRHTSATLVIFSDYFQFADQALLSGYSEKMPAVVIFAESSTAK